MASVDEGREQASEKPSLRADAVREVKFIMVDGELQVEVDNVRFLPRAESVKVGNGWGVQIVVEARARDDQSHHWLAPTEGPLAIAGRIRRARGDENLTDSRQGEDDVVVTKEQPQVVSTRFPREGSKALVGGDSLELELGLWGLGGDRDSRRPVKKFLRLEMRVESGKRPSPRVSPP